MWPSIILLRRNLSVLLGVSVPLGRVSARLKRWAHKQMDNVHRLQRFRPSTSIFRFNIRKDHSASALGGPFTSSQTFSSAGALDTNLAPPAPARKSSGVVRSRSASSPRGSVLRSAATQTQGSAPHGALFPLDPVPARTWGQRQCDRP